jgi:hypothetical protein
VSEIVGDAERAIADAEQLAVRDHFFCVADGYGTVDILSDGSLRNDFILAGSSWWGIRTGGSYAPSP